MKANVEDGANKQENRDGANHARRDDDQPLAHGVENEVGNGEKEGCNADSCDGQSKARRQPRRKQISVHPTKLLETPQVRNQRERLMVGSDVGIKPDEQLDGVKRHDESGE